MKLQAGMQKIKELLKAIEETDIEEICYENKGLNIGIRKNISQEVAEEVEEKTQKKEKSKEKKIIEVVSHSVGLFRDYLSPSRKALARVGDNLNKGQKIGFIESMKLMKEIVSPAKGKVGKKFVKHGDPIEYGQKLFEIEIV
jgi:acetyl-CoA carboxylase biotin carboxyl carrier protein